MVKDRTIITGDAHLRKIRPPASGRIIYKDKAVPALYLRVTSKGKMTWYVMGRLNGKLDRFTIGQYAIKTSSHVSLKKARNKAEEIKEKLRASEDTKEEIIEERERKKDTFSAIRQLFLSQYVERNLKHNSQLQYRSILESKRLSSWENKPVNNLLKRDVLAVIDDIAAEDKLVLANRTLACLRKFFNWCAEKDIIKENEGIPTARISPPLKKERSRKRFLSKEEVNCLWCVCNDEGYP